jgi:hypothetical protein
MVRWIALILLAVACSSPPYEQKPAICKDEKTGVCSACPGAAVCVDPIACKVVECSKDITFGDGKTDTDAATDATDTADAKTETGAQTADAVVDAPVDGPAPDVALDLPADAPCGDGAKKCVGKTVYACQQGAWKLETVCSQGLVCNDGGCDCANPCPALNLVECVAGIPATRACQLTPAGCLAWGLPIACKPGESCQLGQCKAPPPVCDPACGEGFVCVQGKCVAKSCDPPCASGQTCTLGQCQTPKTGSLSCGQVVACVGGQCAPPADESCKVACIEQGTASAQQQFQAFQGCLQSVCKSFKDKPNEALLCIYGQCGTQQAACLGSGSGTCADLNNCLGECGSSTACGNTCAGKVSTQAGVDYYTLWVCIDQSCAGQQGDGLSLCAQQKCPLS